MRADMFKVIVERPRRGGSWSKSARPFWRSEEAFAKIGMKRGHRNRKALNEHLGPLRKFLARQVGRPWNAVFSEICAVIDSRSTVKQHVRSHIGDFVAIDTTLIDGAVYGSSYASPHTPLSELREDFYVDPASGLLMRNHSRITAAQQRRDRTRRRQRELDLRLRVLSPFEELHREHGVWYFVQLVQLPKCRKEVRFTNGKRHEVVVHEKRWDALLRKAVCGRTPSYPTGHGSRVEAVLPYRSRGLYAVSKRQLGARELRRNGLK